ncbi:MAG: hypothetical protein JNG85_16455, partial [Spirochaetaceae bacterium]|nr:hypothetical protein [Spirochaetaceae bacterium]
AGPRLGALFADAEKRFLALLAADKGFGQALASQAKGASFSIALLEAAVPDGSRRFAVSVRASRKKEGAAEAELVLAPKASLVGPLYARAFAEAAGLEAELKAAGPAAFLRRYRVEFVAAYPSGKELSILPLERFPPVDDPGLALSLSFAELEADFLAGGLR